MQIHCNDKISSKTFTNIYRTRVNNCTILKRVNYQYLTKKIITYKPFISSFSWSWRKHSWNCDTNCYSFLYIFLTYLARTARCKEPSLNHTSLPSRRFVATENIFIEY